MKWKYFLVEGSGEDCQAARAVKATHISAVLRDAAEISKEMCWCDCTDYQIREMSLEEYDLLIQYAENKKGK